MSSSQEKTHTVYVLELTGHNFYVGRTSRPLAERIEKHLKGEGCEWTRLHHVVGLVHSEETTDGFLEDTITKKLMLEHGIDHVRGGSYTSIVLLRSQEDTLRREFCTAGNTCFVCRQHGHVARDCSNRFSIHADGTIAEKPPGPKYQRAVTTHTHTYGSGELASSSSSLSSSSTGSHHRLSLPSPLSRKPSRHSITKAPSLDTVDEARGDTKPLGRCFRCGRHGHWISKCYATTTVDGDTIEDSRL